MRCGLSRSRSVGAHTSLSGRKLRKGDVPRANICSGVALACWCTFDEHFITLCALVAQVECCSIPCDWSVSDPLWVKVVVTSSHLVGVLGFQNAGCEWLHFIAIDWLIAGLLVMLQSDVSRWLADIEVLLLAVVWCTRSKLTWFLGCSHFSSGHVDNNLLKLGCEDIGHLCGWSLLWSQQHLIFDLWSPLFNF